VCASARVLAFSGTLSEEALPAGGDHRTNGSWSRGRSASTPILLARGGAVALRAMRAIVLPQVGGPEVLELREVQAPVPKPGQVLVEIRARGVNFADTETRRARYRMPPLPSILGSEGAGVVIETGAGVDPAWRGRRVALYAQPPAVSGTYAELATCPAEALMPLPDGLDFVTAAAVPAQGLTAYLLVHRAARITAGQVVVVHAAAGGVGLLAVQMARRRGARVLGTVSSDDKASAVREAGGEPLRHGDDLVDRVRASTSGRGVDVVLDSIGLPTQAASLAMLAPFGELVHFGDAGGDPAPIDPAQLYARSIKVSAFGLDERHDPTAAAQARRDLIAWAADGSLRFRISRTLALAEAAEAHRLIESRATIGKLVLTS
jgi:NADPH2:quinone reductase